MLDMAILTFIVSLCQISALEDNKSKWTELKNVEKYQLECRIWYMDCVEKEAGINRYLTKHVQKCIKNRLKK